MRSSIHVGEYLKDELITLGISVLKFSDIINVPASRVYRIVNGQSSMSVDMALRLGKFFKTGAEFWLNLQHRYDIKKVERRLSKEVDKITTLEELSL